MRVAAVPLCWVLLVSSMAGGCRRAGGPESEAPVDRLAVSVSILPMASLAERVGGEHVTVDVLVPPGASPATYEPTPRQMTRLASARVYFRVGVPFEDALIPKIRALFQGLRIVDVREGIDLAPIDEASSAGAADPDGHAHAGGELDPHIWLDPTLAARMARTMATTLEQLDPAHAGAYRRNLAGLESDLSAVDAEVRAVLEPLKDRTLLVFHPAFGYFARRYGLRQVAVETGGKDPGARQLARLIDQARAERARVIFVQPQFSRRSAETVARAIDGVVVLMDPLARDYCGNLRHMAATIRAHLAEPEPQP